MEADDLTILFELFESTPRQGPGSVETTRRGELEIYATTQLEREVR